MATSYTDLVTRLSPRVAKLASAEHRAAAAAAVDAGARIEKMSDAGEVFAELTTLLTSGPLKEPVSDELAPFRHLAAAVWADMETLADRATEARTKCAASLDALG